jgi:molybdopterin-guanine dinucleotide biosynthesis protein A
MRGVWLQQMLIDARTTTAIILAGGRSSRMGVDKASLLHEGQTFLQRAIAVATPLASEVLVVARPDSPVALRRPVDGGPRLVLDERQNAGPLAGIEAGLRAMTWERAIVLSVDAPSTSPALLRALLCAYTHDVDVVLARTGRQVNGLVAVWGVSALAAVSAQLDAGSRSVQRALEVLRQRFVEPSVWRMADVRGRTFVNINTAQQYAEQLVFVQGVDE